MKNFKFDRFLPSWEYYVVENYKYMRKKIDLKIAVWKEGKYYVAQCLNVDISSFGKTKKEASLALNEALGLYFE